MKPRLGVIFALIYNEYFHLAPCLTYDPVCKIIQKMGVTAESQIINTIFRRKSVEKRILGKVNKDQFRKRAINMYNFIFKNVSA